MDSWCTKFSNYMGGWCLGKLNSMGGWVNKRGPSSSPRCFFSGIALIEDTCISYLLELVIIFWLSLNLLFCFVCVCTEPTGHILAFTQRLYVEYQNE